MSRRLDPTAATRLLQGMVALAGAGIAIMWWHHTPTSLQHPSFVALAVGRLAGLFAGLLSVVLVLLMARIGPVERRIGADRLARLHARIGRYTLLLVLVHVPLVVWGYAGATRTPVVPEITILWHDYPYIWSAAVGGFLLLVAGVTSVRRLRRRLDYEVWYYTHLLTYVAIALAFGHQIAVGSDFVHNESARSVWVAGYAVAAGLVLYWRLVRPVVAALRMRATVSQVLREPGGTVSLLVAGRDLERWAAQPGQFFRLRFLARGLWWESHPYSPSAASGSPNLRFTIKPVGRHSLALQQIPLGTRVFISGPFGTLTPRRRTQPDALLIAGGIGITPLRALFEGIPPGTGQVTLIYRCRSEHEVLFRDELDSLATERGDRVVYLVGPTSELADPLGSENLAALVPDIASRDVFLCAPTPMMTQLSTTLRELGVPDRNVHWESFELVESGSSTPRQALGIGVTALVVALLLGIRSDMFTRAGQVVVLGPVATPGGQPQPRPSSNAAGEIVIIGPNERTLYSSVQVQITLRQGRLVDVTPLSLPDRDARSRQLSAMAAPILRREALASDGSQVDVVTGATYTSGAYQQSLQGALAQVPK